MTKRRLADRILDEIIALRRPRSMVLELDEHIDQKSRQDQVLNQTASPFATRRQLIVE
jgi:predicted nucleic acid-binding protein